MSKTRKLLPTNRLTPSFKELVSLQRRSSVEDIVVRAREEKDRNTTESLKILFRHQRAVVIVEHSLASTTASQVL